MGENRNDQDKEWVDSRSTSIADAKPDELTDEEYAQKVKTVRKSVLLGIGGVILLIFVILGVGLWNSTVGIPNRVIATMGEYEVTVAAYQTRVRYYRWALLQEYARINTIVSNYGDVDGSQYSTLDRIDMLLTEPAELGQRVMDSFIEDAMIQRKVDELALVVSEEEIDQEFYARLKGASPNGDNYTDEMFQQDYAAYLEKNTVAGLTEVDVRVMRESILLRSAVYDAVTAGILEGEKQDFFAEWTATQRASMIISIDEKLIEKYTPMEPSFNDPQVFKVLFGISEEDTQATNEARWVD